MEARKKLRSPLKRVERQLALTSVVGTITALETESPKRQVTKIFLDNEPWSTTRTRIIKDLGLAEGQSHQPSLLRERVLEAEKQLGMEFALRLVSYRSRSEYEVLAMLARKKFATETGQWVVNKLNDAGYLNDRAFMRAWINDRMELKGYGRQRIRSELISKGIDVNKINDELDDLYPPVREGKTAHSLIQARLARYAGLDEPVVRRRLTQFLLRRGFSISTAQTVMRELLPSSTVECN